jgi:hypothetical protein
MFPPGFPFEGDEFSNPIFARMGFGGFGGGMDLQMPSGMRSTSKRSKRGKTRKGKTSKTSSSMPTNAGIRSDVDKRVKKRTKKA